jgi:hypothetical protein
MEEPVETTTQSGDDVPAPVQQPTLVESSHEGMCTLNMTVYYGYVMTILFSLSYIHYVIIQCV